MADKNCPLCYGSGRQWNDKEEDYNDCPKCGKEEVVALDETKKDIKIGVKANKECPHCYGTGRYYSTKHGHFKVCEDCNEVYTLFNVDPIEAYTRVCDALRIPLDYVAERPITAIRELGGVGNAQDVASQIDAKLTELTKSFMDLRYMRESFILSLRPHMDVDKIPYTLMQFASERGFTVLPYITITELYSLQTVYDLTKDEYTKLANGLHTDGSNTNNIISLDGVQILKEYGKTYYDFIHDEVCFIKIPANPPARAFYALADLIQSRASKNLPTYVISYTFPFTYKTGGLEYLLNKTNRPTLKKLTELSLIPNTRRDFNQGTYFKEQPNTRGMTVSEL